MRIRLPLLLFCALTLAACAGDNTGIGSPPPPPNSWCRNRNAPVPSAEIKMPATTINHKRVDDRPTAVGIPSPGTVCPGIVCPGIVWPGYICPGIVCPGYICPGTVCAGSGCVHACVAAGTEPSIGCP